MNNFILITKYPRNTIVLARLGSTLRDKLIIVITQVWFTLQYRFGFSPSLSHPREISFVVFDNVLDITIQNTLDLAICREIFVDKQYKIQVSQMPRIIFDLGSNIGISILYFAAQFPDAHIFAFEPDPDNIKLLKMNVKTLGDRVTIIEKAVSPKPCKKIRLYKFSDAHWSSSLLERDGATTYVDVETTSIDVVMKEFDIDNIDILKFDIEGSEESVLTSFKNILKVKLLIGELHPQLMENSIDSFISGINGFELLQPVRDNIVVLINTRLS